MARLTLDVTGPATPATVWERYVRVDRWASWSPQIRGVHTDVLCITPALQGTVESFAGLRIPFVVESVDHRHRTWAWRVRLGPVRLRLHHAVRPDPQGSAASVTLHGPMPVLAGYAPLARVALRRLVRP
ncbi:SRPBCC family protein [Streptomyces sp. JHA26]|uniref:SRPBCC family protein n=1 Tax=Streptomyces sp. JHA26 TaxID=1917143 RepID=UPI00098A03E3|nr:SRPBCC family protein [Streptomyces sp. JHA26]